ncbi:Hypothetical protein FKW44_012361 [Caligus rogercresseyi]|uniref:Uncharacterized protein n=1 Tax=Caligus rogercresseyi TaxID=217165 RepID=A0A7T8K8R9_CALRO|nr:Hypothetical protein FKW44_012361 [Caligus rogercresseyi]
MMASDEAQIAQLSDLVAHKTVTSQSYFNLLDVLSRRLSRPEINERCKALGLPEISQADYDQQIQQAAMYSLPVRREARDTGAKRRREASEEERTAKSSRVSEDTSDSESNVEEESEPEAPTAGSGE